MKIGTTSKGGGPWEWQKPWHFQNESYYEQESFQPKGWDTYATKFKNNPPLETQEIPRTGWLQHTNH